jgi:CRISPR-associated protein Cas2
MLIVIANYLPPAVRGRMKLWFIEPKPNVFISGIKDSVADDVIEFLHKYCPDDSGLMVFQRINKAPGYKIRGLGETNRTLIQKSGLQLIQEKDGITKDNNIL